MQSRAANRERLQRMHMIHRASLSGMLCTAAIGWAVLAVPAVAAQGPVDLAAAAQPAKPAQSGNGPKSVSGVPAPAASSSTQSAPTATAPATPEPVPVAQPAPPPLAHWALADAQALLAAIKGIGREGLAPADYEPAKLAAQIAKGEGEDLDALASRLFVWLAEDLRDGRTPMPARVQWFAIDPDQDLHPHSQLLAQATETHDVPGVLTSPKPTPPDDHLPGYLQPHARDPAPSA